MIKNLLGFGLMSLFLVLVSSTAYSQACTGNAVTISIQNVVTTSTTIEYDVYIKNTSANPTRMNAYAGNVLYNANM